MKTEITKLSIVLTDIQERDFFKKRDYSEKIIVPEVTIFYGHRKLVNAELTSKGDSDKDSILEKKIGLRHKKNRWVVVGGPEDTTGLNSIIAFSLLDKLGMNHLGFEVVSLFVNESYRGLHLFVEDPSVLQGKGRSATVRRLSSSPLLRSGGMLSGQLLQRFLYLVAINRIFENIDFQNEAYFLFDAEGVGYDIQGWDFEELFGNYRDLVDGGLFGKDLKNPFGEEPLAWCPELSDCAFILKSKRVYLQYLDALDSTLVRVLSKTPSLRDDLSRKIGRSSEIPDKEKLLSQLGDKFTRLLKNIEELRVKVKLQQEKYIEALKKHEITRNRIYIPLVSGDLDKLYYSKNPIVVDGVEIAIAGDSTRKMAYQSKGKTLPPLRINDQINVKSVDHYQSPVDVELAILASNYFFERSASLGILELSDGRESFSVFIHREHHQMRKSKYYRPYDVLTAEIAPEIYQGFLPDVLFVGVKDTFYNLDNVEWAKGKEHAYLIPNDFDEAFRACEINRELEGLEKNQIKDKTVFQNRFFSYPILLPILNNTLPELTRKKLLDTFEKALRAVPEKEKMVKDLLIKHEKELGCDVSFQYKAWAFCDKLHRSMVETRVTEESVCGKRNLELILSKLKGKRSSHTVISD